MVSFLGKLMGAATLSADRRCGENAWQKKGLQRWGTGSGKSIQPKNRRRPRRTIVQIVARIKPASYHRRSRQLADRGPVGREFW
jgi:hypothetical protein